MNPQNGKKPDSAAKAYFRKPDFFLEPQFHHKLKAFNVLPSGGKRMTKGFSAEDSPESSH